MSERPKFGLRLLAFGLDYLVICGIIAISLAIGLLLHYGPFGQFGRTVTESPIAGQLVGFLGLTLPTIVYFAISESSQKQATWGKRRLGLQVVDSQTGGRLSFWRALGRAALKFAPWELSHTLIWRIEGWPMNPADPGPIIMAGFALVGVLVLSYLIGIAVSKTGQGVYDQLTGTRVVMSTLQKQLMT